MDYSQVKSVDIKNGRKRIRFESSKKRSKKATADVYRSFEKRLQVTTAAPREQHVHGVTTTTQDNDNVETFASELDVAIDRNGSLVFEKFYNQVWPLVRSLSEIVHHLPKIVNLLLSYMLSPYDNTDVPGNISDDKNQRFVINLATTDILHLMAVLAKNVRHELHPYLHSLIIPRIVYDLLNPPQQSANDQPLNVVVIEAAFRALSYILKYDAAEIIKQVSVNNNNDKNDIPCLELMRTYYGPTLAHRREVIRRLAAETWAPLVRKLPLEKAKIKHVKRVVRALQNSTIQDKQDAIDGIGGFCFYIVKGVVGKLHSKSQFVTTTLVEMLLSSPPKDDAAKTETLLQVICNYFHRLIDHAEVGLAVDQVQHVLTNLDKLLAVDKVSDQLVMAGVRLINSIVAHRNEKLLRNSNHLSRTLTQTLVTSFNKNCFTQLARATRDELMLCTSLVWKSTTDTEFGSNILNHIETIIIVGTERDNDTNYVYSPAFRLLTELVSVIDQADAVENLYSTIISAAAVFSPRNEVVAISLINAVAIESQRCNDSESVAFVNLDIAAMCSIKVQDKKSIIKSCVAMDVEKVQPSLLVAAIRCAVFVAAASVANDKSWSKSDDAGLNQKVVDWLLSISEHEMTKKDSHSALITAVAFESFARLLGLTATAQSGDKNLQDIMERGSTLATSLVSAHGTSISMVKSIAVYTAVLKKFANKHLPMELDNVLDILTPNLAHKNHFMRIHTLDILSTFPQLNFVVDHADLNLADDLDEEPSTMITTPKSASSSVLFGVCNILKLLHQLESTKPSIQSERTISTILSNISTLCRTGKLPVLYAEAVASHLFGLLYSKYTPMWKLVIDTIAALAKVQENCVWPVLHIMLERLFCEQRNDESSIEVVDNLTDASLTHHLQVDNSFTYNVEWETSSGCNYTLYQSSVEALNSNGVLSWHQSCEDLKVVQSVWKLAESAPHLLVNNSKVVVPLVLQTIVAEYFVSRPFDPEYKQLEAQLEQSETIQSSIGRFSHHQICQILASVFAALASVKKPRALYKHKALQLLFESFLGHYYEPLCQSSLTCLLNYKLPYVVSYSDSLSKLMDRSKFRNALLDIKTLFFEDKVENSHRYKYLCLVARILKGQLLSRKQTRSSKDSIASRRTAAYSTVASICKSEQDLFPFVFLLVRGYIRDPPGMESLEDKTNNFDYVIEMMANVDRSHIANIPLVLHTGFMNTLEAVVSQLGHLVSSLASTFLSLLIEICQTYQIVQTEVDDDDSIEEQSMNSFDVERSKAGPVRTLCFRLFTLLFTKYGSALDAAMYTDRLWTAVGDSLPKLSSAVTSPGKAPALLQLMKVISSDHHNIQFFTTQTIVVKHVIECFSKAKSIGSTNTVLDIMTNLVKDERIEGENANMCGQELMLLYADDILREFEAYYKINGARGGNKFLRELFILQNLFDLLRTTSSESIERVDRLCLLVVPYLHSKTKRSEEALLAVIDLITAMLPYISKDTMEAVYFHLVSCLEPSALKVGVEDIDARKRITKALTTILEKEDVSYSTACTVLNSLCSVSSSRINELEQDAIISALYNLSQGDQQSSWQSMCNGMQEPDLRIIKPLVLTCCHYIFNEDPVISRAAQKSVVSFVDYCVKFDGSDTNIDATTLTDHEKAWLTVVEKHICPIIRSGINSKSESSRRYFILTLLEVVRHTKNLRQSNLHYDLCSLIRDDEPDLDFFRNVMHVQVHRRARALQRLRKSLVGSEQSNFSTQSLTGVILPIVVHFIYECKVSVEESLVTEAIATVGALAKFVPWKVYGSLLLRHMNQVERHKDRERYIISLICAIVDSFHFDISETDSVLTSLKKLYIPKLEQLLTKSVTDRLGKRQKKLRPVIALSMVKLLKKLGKVDLEKALPRLFAIFCSNLKSSESDTRDAARQTLAKICGTIDLAYLRDVLRELAISLTEGSQLHVRAATVYTILSELENLASNGQIAIPNPSLDASVPSFIDLIQQDLFGEAQERRDENVHQVRHIKEAKGLKGPNSLELLASMISIGSSVDTVKNVPPLPVLHTLVSPFVERICQKNITSKEINLMKDCMSKVISGLRRNKDVDIGKVLTFTMLVVRPFVTREVEFAMFQDIINDEDEASDDDEQYSPIKVSGSKDVMNTPVASASKGPQTIEWRPSMKNAITSVNEAKLMKVQAEKRERKVVDGTSAPKLTGSHRYRNAAEKSEGYSSTANVVAVSFSLQLLHTCLKRMEDSIDAKLLRPFAPLLADCVCACRDMELVLLGMKCCEILIKLDPVSMTKHTKMLAQKTVELLTSSGISSEPNQEVLHACLKLLACLLTPVLETSIRETTSMKKTKKKLVLDEEQMKILLLYLQEAVTDASRHNSAMNIVKLLLNESFVSVEFYDLMETLLEQSVRSTKPTLRKQCGDSFIRFLTNYPMSEDRMLQHLNQIVQNIKFDHIDGRLSGIMLLDKLVLQLPLPALEKHAHMIFLSLTLQLANDVSPKCREELSKAIKTLLSRLPTKSLQSFEEYMSRWLSESSLLRRTAFQLYKLLFDAKPDFIGTDAYITKIVNAIQTTLADDGAGWDEIYFALLCFVEINKIDSESVCYNTNVWTLIVKCLGFSHMWVKSISARLLAEHLLRIDQGSLYLTAAHKKAKSFFLTNNETLHNLARYCCTALNIDEDDYQPELESSTIKMLTWLLPVIDKHKEMCFTKDSDDVNSSNIDPVQWVMYKLARNATARGPLRRQGVYKCFAALVNNEQCCPIAMQHLDCMLEPLHRTDVESSQRNRQQDQFLAVAANVETKPETPESMLAQEVIQLLEEKSTESNVDFIPIYQEVRRKALEKKEERKQAEKALVITNPELAAKNKLKKRENDKIRRKRKMDDDTYHHRKGGFTKQRRNNKKY